MLCPPLDSFNSLLLPVEVVLEALLLVFLGNLASRFNVEDTAELLVVNKADLVLVHHGENLLQNGAGDWYVRVDTLDEAAKVDETCLVLVNLVPETQD